MRPVTSPAATENETWRRTSRPDNETDRSSTDRAAPSLERLRVRLSVQRASSGPCLPGASQPYRRSPLGHGCQQGVNLGQHPRLVVVAGDRHRSYTPTTGTWARWVGEEASGQAVGDLLVVEEDLHLVPADHALLVVMSWDGSVPFMTADWGGGVTISPPAV